MFRVTVWIAALLGSAVIATSAALLVGALAENLHPGAFKLGAGLGCLLGLGAAARTYASVGRIARLSVPAG